MDGENPLHFQSYSQYIFIQQVKTGTSSIAITMNCDVVMNPMWMTHPPVYLSSPRGAPRGVDSFGMRRSSSSCSHSSEGLPSLPGGVRGSPPHPRYTPSFWSHVTTHTTLSPYLTIWRGTKKNGYKQLLGR